ncbi:MAG: hypothetical protein WCT31_05040, partial [Candidatus Micrarchaeia archaeon]
MREVLKNLAELEENEPTTRLKEYTSLAAEFEKTVSADFPSKNTASKAIEMAKKIRNILSGDEIALERESKLRLLKMLNKAKVRALLANQEYT